MTTDTLLVAHGSLFRVVELTEAGYRVHCENGGWYGDVDTAAGTISLDGDDPEGKNLPFVVESRTQPPAHLTHYNEIIPWMIANKDAA